MYRKLVAVVGMSLMIGSASTSAIAVSKRTAAVAEADVRALVRMMDKDQNGVVSKEEFMQYMGEVFDRLDVNRSGQLEANEVRSLASRDWLACNTLAFHRGVNVNDRRSTETGPSDWRQFMTSCLAGRVR
jgi:Ca2+-binding EF-hand superfamily protein